MPLTVFHYKAMHFFFFFHFWCCSHCVWRSVVASIFSGAMFSVLSNLASTLQRKKESYLLYLNCLPDAMLLTVFCAFLSQSHRLICAFGLSLCHILVTHTDYTDLYGSLSYCFTHAIKSYVPTRNTIRDSNTLVKVLFFAN